MKPAGKLSVIIPVLWDADDLRLLLARLAQLSEPPDEIICVDGDADPETRQACLQAGARYLQSETGRGMQLDTGARAATGNWLWFLHADASPPMNGAIAVRQALGRGAVGGWFRFRFAQTDHVLARSLATLINWRCWLGVPYGDQGIFATANAYRTAGGFPDEPLFEEVPLIKALRRLGEFRPLPQSMGVSPRRWQHDGWLRRSLSNRALATAYMLGVPPARLARAYRGARHGRAQC